MTSLISRIPPASADEAYAHFSNRLRLETDCSDVYYSQQIGQIDYVLVDVRGTAAFANGHVPGAINLPTKTITSERLAEFPADSLFVVYCAGPHCNGVHRAAARIAQLGYAVKEMIGGVTGWLDEGLSLSNGDDVQSTSTSIPCTC